MSDGKMTNVSFWCEESQEWVNISGTGGKPKITEARMTLDGTVVHRDVSPSDIPMPTMASPEVVGGLLI